MPFQDMIEILERRIATRPGLSSHVDQSRKRPRVGISPDAEPHRWAEVELDDEVFFLFFDDGSQLVASELWAPAQAELLVDLADVASAYLVGNYRPIAGRGLLGRRWTGMSFGVNGNTYVTKRNLPRLFGRA